MSRSQITSRRLIALLFAACLSVSAAPVALAQEVSPAAVDPDSVTETTQPAATPEPSGSAPPPAGGPEGTWTAIAYDPWGDGLLEPRRGSTLTVSLLPAGRLEGQTGCGTYVGGYSVDAERIRLGVLSKGSEACGRKRTEEAFAFTQALAAASTWTPTSSGLELLDESGLVRVVLERPSGGDVSGEWLVRRYARGDGRLIDPLDDAALTAVFGEDGVVTGSTGCRFFDGRVETEADRIVITEIDRVGLSCEGTERKQERRYLRLLGDVVRWQRDGRRLVLTDGAGEPLIELESRPATIEADANEADANEADANESAEPTPQPA